MDYREKRALIEQLMDHWEDFFSVASSGQLVTEEPDPTKKVELKDFTVFSTMSRHHSVVELRRCLEVLRTKLPKHYAVIAGFYGAERKGAWSTRQVKTRNGKLVREPVRVQARIVPSWIGGPKVPRCLEVDCPCGGEMSRMLCRSHDVLLGLWGRVRLELPQPLERKLRPFMSEEGVEGWTEAA